MKFSSRIIGFIASMFLTATAMGGGGMGGGGFGKTTDMLQFFEYIQAVPTYEGAVNIPDSDTLPKLVIPAEEYKDFIAEIGKEDKTGEQFVLPVEMKDGSVRNFTLCYDKEELHREPLFFYLIMQGEKCLFEY